ncbi:MAG: histidine kinase [Saprospiraceae bacterium]|nr:histidine kinase [Saprospiraceae bacterium]
MTLTLLKKALQIMFLAGGVLCFICRVAAQPAGAKPIPTPNGEIWMVDESWFDKQPPFLEFYRYGEREGLRLTSSAVLLLQDSRGDIWLADDGKGVFIRFDGHTFWYYSTNQNDPAGGSGLDPDINRKGVFEMPDGRLWLRHEKGFTCYNPQRDSFLIIPVALDSTTTLPSLFFENFNAGDSYFNAQINRFIRVFRTKVVDGTNPVRSAEETMNWLLHPGWVDKTGNVWAAEHTAVGRGLVCVNPSSGTTTLYPMLGMMSGDRASSPEYDPWITAFCPDANGENIWVSGWRGSLRRFNLKTKRWTQLYQNYKRDKNGINTNLETTLFIIPAPEGKLWLGTNHGLSLFDPANFKFQAWWKTDQPGSYHPGSHGSSTALNDSEGRLWVSAGSLQVHDEDRHFVRKPVLDIPKGRIKSAFHDVTDNKTWFLKEDNYQEGTGGLYALDESTGKVQAFILPVFYNKQAPDDLLLYGLAKRGEDVFFNSEHSIYKLHIPNGKITEIKIPVPPELAHKAKHLSSLRGIAPAADGSCWISIYNSEINIPLVHFYPDQNRFEYIRKSPDGLTVQAGGCILVARNGKIWLASSDTERSGVNCYDPATGKVSTFRHDPANPFSIQHNLVRGMVEDSLGRIWMATETGVCWYDPSDEKFRQVPEIKGIFYHIAIDHAQHVWMSGDLSACYHPETGKLQVIGEENGLYWFGEVLYTRSDGAVCWGPYYRILPDKIPLLKNGPVCRFTEFKVFNKDYPLPRAVDFLEQIELAHTDNTFSIGWSARNFTNPEKDSFYYQLEGMDEGWVAIGSAQRSASYLKIPPGDYRFRLKCKNRDGIFGPEKTLRICIVPAFWQTWWFKLMLMMALASIVAVIASLQQRQKRMAAELKQREAEFRQREAELNQRISEYQVAALRAQMNPHFIFNSLNSINRFVQLSGPDTASNYLTKFARLMRLVLDHSRSDMIPLDNEIEAIRLYLDLESLRFAGQFDYRLTVSPTLDVEMLDVPPLFIQPYLENAIWHGLMQKEHKDRRLDISIHEKKPGWLAVEITDNGIGRQQAQELKSKTATRQKSHGMDITAARMKLFTDRTGRKVDLQIEDLFDEKGLATGTRVVILLEIKNL